MILKLLRLVKGYQSQIILTISVVLLTLASFNLGKLSVIKQNKHPITIQNNNSSANINTAAAAKLSEEVVASRKSPNKYYHFLWCAGAKQIAEQNKLKFTNEAAAIAAGYSLAGNCKK